MTLKVGDTIRIRKDLIAGNKYGKNAIYFAREMEQYRGEKAKIIRIFNTGNNIDVDNGTFNWDEEMFEKIIITDWQKEVAD